MTSPEEPSYCVAAMMFLVFSPQSVQHLWAGALGFPFRFVMLAPEGSQL